MMRFLTLAIAAFVLAAGGSLPASAQEMTEEQLMKRGKRVFVLCRSCHTLDEGGRNKVGPNLHGMFGNSAGVKEGFRYSDVVKDSGIVWSAETLEEWLVKPKDFLPGNKMAFAGVRKESDRKALITYLMAETTATE
ncbi:MAG: cytochrome c family protein [Rhodospirillaceae bacterium]|nr:cytochrome c family protein [Rhodospirillaceae bacterium]